MDKKISLEGIMLNKEIERLVMVIGRLEEEIKRYEMLENAAMIKVNKELIRKCEEKIGRCVVVLYEK